MTCSPEIFWPLVMGVSAFWLVGAWLDRRRSDRKIAQLEAKIRFLER